MSPIRITDTYGCPTLVQVIPGTATTGAQLAVSHSHGSSCLHGLTPEVCYDLARRLIAEADRMRRVDEEDQRIRDAIAA